MCHFYVCYVRYNYLCQISYLCKTCLDRLWKDLGALVSASWEGWVWGVPHWILCKPLDFGSLISIHQVLKKNFLGWLVSSVG